MLVVNDIGLINGLKALRLFSIGEFHFSELYMHDPYLTPVERQSIKSHAANGEIVVFEPGSGFFDFYYKCEDDCPITMPGLSSVYYAKENNMVMVTNSRIDRKVAEQYGVNVCACEEAFRNLNVQQGYIDFLMKFINGAPTA